MARWTTGPICGVDNCRSKHWQVIDGQHVCRNGHVREGDVEIAEDAEVEGGRYMRAGRSIRSDRNDPSLNRRSRAEEQLAEHQSLVYILKIQAEYLVKEKGVPSEIMVWIYNILKKKCIY